MLSATQSLSEKLPAHNCRHVAIIMDGNDRWAEEQGKIRVFGHKAGVKFIRRAIFFAANNDVEALTLYAFSGENWNRPTQEVSALVELFVWALDSEVKSLHRHNVRLRIIGDTNHFSSHLQERIRKSEALTVGNTGLTLNIVANYDGYWDIVQEVRQLAKKVQQGNLQPDQIDEEMLNQHVYMHELAPVDLVIRTRGEHRISNFLLRQIAYAELYSTDVLWPDFGEQGSERTLNTFANQKRRFGGTEPGGETAWWGSLLLKYYLISALVLVPVVIATLFLLPPMGFAVVTLAVCILTAWEWGQLSGFTARSQRVWLAVLCGLLLVLMLFLLPEYHRSIHQPLVEISLWALLGWWIVALLLVLFYPGSAAVWRNSKTLRLIFGVLTVVSSFWGMLALRA